MTYTVKIYYIRWNFTRRRKFKSEEQANAYAFALKQAYLNRENPAPVFIDVVAA